MLALSALRGVGQALRSRLAGATDGSRQLRHEHVVHYERPAFLVHDGRCVTPLADAWRPRLARDHIDRAIACVGRFSSSESARVGLGTGWRVRPNVIVTNRHLALYFAERRRHGATLHDRLRG